MDREKLSWLQANLKAFNRRDIREEDGLEESRKAIFEDVAGTVDPNLVLSAIHHSSRSTRNGANSRISSFLRLLSIRWERYKKRMRQFRKLNVLLRFY